MWNTPTWNSSGGPINVIDHLGVAWSTCRLGDVRRLGRPSNTVISKSNPDTAAVLHKLRKSPANSVYSLEIFTVSYDKNPTFWRTRNNFLVARESMWDTAIWNFSGGPIKVIKRTLVYCVTFCDENSTFWRTRDNVRFAKETMWDNAAWNSSGDLIKLIQ